MSKCPFKVNSKDTSIFVVDLIQYIPIGKWNTKWKYGQKVQYLLNGNKNVMQVYVAGFFLRKNLNRFTSF